MWFQHRQSMTFIELIRTNNKIYYMHGLIYKDKMFRVYGIVDNQLFSAWKDEKQEEFL